MERRDPGAPSLALWALPSSAENGSLSRRP